MFFYPLVCFVTALTFGLIASRVLALGCCSQPDTTGTDQAEVPAQVSSKTAKVRAPVCVADALVIVVEA